MKTLLKFVLIDNPGQNMYGLPLFLFIWHSAKLNSKVCSFEVFLLCGIEI